MTSPIFATPFAPRHPTVGVIALVPDRWAGPWGTRHHVLSRLAAHFHVLWVEPAHERGEVIGRAVRPRAALGGPAEYPGLVVYTPEPWLPRLFRPAGLARWVDAQRVLRAQRALQARGCDRFVLYLWRPEYAEALEHGAFDLTCYHIDDEYAFTDEDAPLGDAERRLIERVDQVFIHSPGLMERKGGINPRTRFVPLGVDYDAFATPQPEPADLASVPRPRVGYAGTLKRQLDWPLLVGLAERHPGWSFVLLGGRAPHPEIAERIRRLAALPNVYFLGPREARRMPAYQQHFDVGIMPYRLTGYAQMGYPLKLHEYLATGRPAVGVPMRTLLDFRDVVPLARGIDEWSAALERALGPVETGSERRGGRRAVARRHDWDRLIGGLAETVAGQLGARPRDPVLAPVAVGS